VCDPKRNLPRQVSRAPPDRDLILDNHMPHRGLDAGVSGIKRPRPLNQQREMCLKEAKWSALACAVGKVKWLRKFSREDSQQALDRLVLNVVFIKISPRFQNYDTRCAMSSALEGNLFQTIPLHFSLIPDAIFALGIIIPLLGIIFASGNFVCGIVF